MNKAGVLIVLFNLLERMETLGKIDVFRAVKDLQDIKANMMFSKVKWDEALV